MKKASLFFVALTALVSFAFTDLSETKQINVVIDAGHGGRDHGATIDNYTEKAIVEQITNKIKAQNANSNIVIHLIRDADEFKTFEERTGFINSIKPDLVISLHVNQNKNTMSSGIGLYVCNENTAYSRSNELAERLNRKFMENNSFKSGGVKEAKFAILKKSEAPAVLVELGFLSNPYDRKYLTDDNEQNRIASTILEFMSELQQQ